MTARSPYASNKFEEENTNTSWFKIVHMIPKGSVVLDVGCSSGNLGAYLKDHGIAPKVDGIDIDEDDVKLASKKLDHAIVANIEEDSASLSTLGTYDVIVFADVLEHMKDASKVLVTMKSLLNPKGRIIFSIPNMAHLFIRLQLLEGKFPYTRTGLLDKTHLHFYDEYEVRRIFSEAGYNIEKFDCTILDYPDQLIAEKLSLVGLKLTPQFSELVHKKQSTIFEFIGYAEISSKSVKLPLSTTSPLDEVLGFLQRLKDAEESKTKDLDHKLQLTIEHEKKLQEIITKLQQENNLLLQHPGKTIAKKYSRKVKSKFRN
jgi:2-polyprenyl-3-methyl-5-hydroxy-6-metoxy-1,4-benzoquinol methylase